MWPWQAVYLADAGTVNDAPVQIQQLRGHGEQTFAILSFFKGQLQTQVVLGLLRTVIR